MNAIESRPEQECSGGRVGLWDQSGERLKGDEKKEEGRKEKGECESQKLKR